MEIQVISQILSGWRLNTDKFHSPTTAPESAGAGGPGLQNRRRWPDESQIPQPAPTGRNQHFPGPGEELPTLRNRLHNIRAAFGEPFNEGSTEAGGPHPASEQTGG